jgi:Fe-S cluster assembly scaffold protein SufB
VNERIVLSTLPPEARYEVKRDSTLELLLPVTEVVGDHRIEVVLSEPGASAKVIGAVVADSGVGTLDIVTRHAAPNTTGSTLLRSVLGGTAEVSSKGLIRIESNAAKTVDFLEERFLLVSKNAKAQADPQLEIETDDVKASHAASCGPVDPLQVFYLCSRGIPKQQVVRMLSEAFLAPALDSMPKEAQERVLRKFHTLSA